MTSSTAAANIDGLLVTTHALATEAGADQLAAEVDRLARDRLLPSVRLAVLGEQVTKAAPLNDLFGRPVVPALDSSQRLRSFAATRGPERIELIGDRSAEGGGLPLGPAAWDAVDRAGGADPVTVRLDADFLRELDAEILDVPMRGRNPHEDAEIRRALTRCDAAALVVAAASQPTRAEEDLLHEVLARLQVARAAVVVVDLDRVALEDRTEVLAEIRRKADRIALGLPVLIAEPASAGGAELRRLLAEAEGDETRLTRREWQIRAGLGAVLHELSNVADSRTAAARMSAEDRERESRAIGAARSAGAAIWADLRVELAERQNATIRQAQEALGRVAELAVLELREESVPVPDLRSWWQQDLPYRLRRRLIDAAAEQDRAVADRLAVDTTWLRGRLQALGDDAPLPVVPLPPGSTPEVVERLELTDAQRLGYLLRLSAAALPLLALLLKPLVAVPVEGVTAVSQLTTVAVDWRMRSVRQEHRRLVDARLPGVVRRAFSSLSDDTEERLVTVYGAIRRAAEHRWRDRSSARLADLERAPDQPGARWSVLAEETRRLRVRLEAA